VSFRELISTTRRPCSISWRGSIRLADVNVLVYAFRPDARDHPDYRAWLEELVGGDEAYASSDIVLGGFIRVVTHPRIFGDPAPLETALRFAESYRANPNCVLIVPGPRHWEIFSRLCRDSGARGALVADAYLAALAIEWGCEWITTDRDYARFPGLRWRHPLARA
jgi:toxin-antitoxin system PIN domain toxin